jgi:hypothetical protein
MERIQRVFVLLIFAFFLLGVLPATSHASTIVVDPVSDGSLYTCTGCNTAPSFSYVLVGGYIDGEIDFSTASFSGNVGDALLSVNPYGLPLWAPQIEVYGLASTSSTISINDVEGPSTFLGTWTLPAGLGYGQNTYFDVTSFLQTVQTSYVDFILTAPSTGPDVFSSTEYNYGTPPELTVTSAPEPATWALLLLGLATLALQTLASNTRTKLARNPH